MADEQKQEKPEVDVSILEEDFIFDLKEQPTIKVRLSNGEVKSFAADAVLIELMQEGLVTRELADDPETREKIVAIVQKHIGTDEPIGPGMAMAILGRMNLMIAAYRKKALSTGDSGTTSGSASKSSGAPAT